MCKLKIAEKTLLKNIASDFRDRFENTDLSQAPGCLPHFPEGCCNWATWMIGHFLKYELEEDVWEIQAERLTDDGTESHAWLRANDIIIDITSDEFEDSNDCVFVSRNSEWHEAWTVKNIVKIQRIENCDPFANGTPLKPSDVYELLVIDIRKKYARNN